METLMKRLNQYKTEQLPIINRYDTMGLVKTINGNQAIEEVYGQVKTAVTGYIWFPKYNTDREKSEHSLWDTE